MLSRLKAASYRWRILPYVYDRFDLFMNDFVALQRRIDILTEAVGRIENRQLAASPVENIRESEFQAFSQFGEDGIIQFLLRHVDIDRKIFVEFGADNYNFESNTRFLLANNNWTGVIIDGSEDNIRRVRNSASYVLYDLRAVSSFITTANINQILI